MRRVSLIGYPNSLGSYAAGQDLAPTALRDAGLIQTLSHAGLDIRDHGDLPAEVWHPDRAHPHAQNAAEIVEGLRTLTEQITAILASGDTLFVLGGNCLIVLAVMAGLRGLDDGTPGLLYVDRHYDMNTPQSTTDGALDWMGLAHALALPGTVDALVDACGRRPLLRPFQVGWLGVEEAMATQWERDQAARLDLNRKSSNELATDPTGAARSLLRKLPHGPLSVHLDVDVLDFTDAPLSENTDGRNRGPTLQQVAMALSTATEDPRFRALSVGELNPTRSVGDPGALQRFCSALAVVLGSLR